MARHPHVVPGQHHDRDEKDRRVEDFLANPGQGLANCARKRRDKRRADDTRQHAQRYGEPAAGETLRHRQNDADNEPGLDDLTKNNNERAKHRCSLPVFR